MSATQHVIVITDLDGTLLDHNTYLYDAACPALHILKKNNIPLILCSSKTAAEMVVIRQQLENNEPFVVENGAGIYIPTKTNNDHDAYEIICFSKGRESILEALKKIHDKYNLPFTGFNDMQIETIMSLTELTKEQAELAQKRDFTEPLQWQGDASQWEQFCTELTQLGLVAVKGGRFICISGRVNKGQALKWLRNYYQQQFGENPIVIALGDSENDKQMLEYADYSVLIRSPAHELPDIKANNLIISDKFGPEGWNASMTNLLNDFSLIT